VIWETQDGATAYLFHLIASGVMDRFVLPHPGRPMALAQPGRNVILLPGGRAGWVELKLRRDPRLRGAVEAGWHMVKYRHIRRLADYETLNRDNFEEHLKLDPLANRDPQMTLL